MVPRRTSRSTRLTATKPLNSLVSPRVCRMISSAMCGPGRSLAAGRLLECRAIIRNGRRVGNRIAGGPSCRGGSVRPFRSAFFDERVDALVRVGLEQAAGHRLPREIVCGSEAEVDLAVERLFPGGNHGAAPRGDDLGQG